MAAAEAVNPLVDYNVLFFNPPYLERVSRCKSVSLQRL
jgi:hypothetical protein